MSRPAVTPLVDHDDPLREACGDGGGKRAVVDRPAPRHFGARHVPHQRSGDAEPVGELAHRAATVLVQVGEGDAAAVVRQKQARPVGVGEEGDRLARLDQDRGLEALQRLQCDVHRVGQLQDVAAAGAALDPSVRGRRHDHGARPLGDGGEKPEKLRRFQHRTADEEQRRGAAGQRGERTVEGMGVDRRRSLRPHRCGDLAALVPAGVGRGDQRGDPSRRAHGRGERLGGIRADARRRARGADEIGERGRGAGNVGRERRVVGQMPRRVIADEVQHRRARLLGVVDVGAAVGETGGEVEQRDGGDAGHAGIPVGRAGHDALEQAEHAAHQPGAPERVDELHFRGAGVREAD